MPSLQWEPACHLGRLPGAARAYDPKRGAEGSGEELGDLIPPTLYILSATPVPEVRPLPDAPSTLVPATPAHLGFQPPPGSLLGIPSSPTSEHFVLRGAPVSPLYCEQPWLGGGVQPIIDEISSDYRWRLGGPSPPPALQRPSVHGPSTRHLPTVRLCPLPRPCPHPLKPAALFPVRGLLAGSEGPWVRGRGWGSRVRVPVRRAVGHRW